MLTKAQDLYLNMGCDPEFFFKQDGQIIGAEKVLPKHGLTVTRGDTTTSKFIIDGVQAELNPRPSTCREVIAGELRACFTHLKADLTAKNLGVTADFSRTINISEEKLMELDEESRKFGCAPSLNIYKQKTGLKITDVDAAKYLTRAAGGHIHLGRQDGADHLNRALGEDHLKTVALLDLLCGNTSVLLDRDAGNIERRKLYGKAGEFRLPKHGLEYRTLSNYWLTSYPLLSFAFGMARLAVTLMADPRYHDVYYKELTSLVKPKAVHDAINNNDFDLAMENFKAIEKLLMEITPVSGRYPVNDANLKEFHHFVDMVNDKGLGYWFKQDPMTHWTGPTNDTYRGFNDFLRVNVGEDLKKDITKLKAAAEAAGYFYQWN